MPYVIAFIGCVLIPVTGLAVYMYWPSHPEHARPRGMELDVLPPTLAPLPVAEPSWQPRACPDVPAPDQALTGALSAIRHPCYQYAARLAQMSWQSHVTLQRNYDMLAFATVAQAHYRMKARYA